MEAVLANGLARYARHRGRTKRRGRLGRVLVVLGSAIGGCCLAVVGLYLAMAASVSDLKPAPLSASDKAALASTTFQPDAGFPEVDWTYWRTINPAIVGWVTVPDTAIDYAIALADGDDPNYYLSHDVYGAYNLFGCPYIDAGCGPLFESPNTVIYGHHMSNGAMFAAFSLYSDRAFAEAHPFIYVQSPTERRVYEVQAADIINGEDPVKRTSFVDHDDFLAYYADRLAKSDLQRYTTTDASSCITFCTCSYHFNPANERTLVFAKPVSVNGAAVVSDAAPDERPLT